MNSEANTSGPTQLAGSRAESSDFESPRSLKRQLEAAKEELASLKEEADRRHAQHIKRSAELEQKEFEMMNFLESSQRTMRHEQGTVAKVLHPAGHVPLAAWHHSDVCHPHAALWLQRRAAATVYACNTMCHIPCTLTLAPSLLTTPNSLCTHSKCRRSALVQARSEQLMLQQKIDSLQAQHKADLEQLTKESDLKVRMAQKKHNAELDAMMDDMQRQVEDEVLDEMKVRVRGCNQFCQSACKGCGTASDCPGADRMHACLCRCTTRLILCEF